MLPLIYRVWYNTCHVYNSPDRNILRAVLFVSFEIFPRLERLLATGRAIRTRVRALALMSPLPVTFQCLQIPQALAGRLGILTLLFRAILWPHREWSLFPSHLRHWRLRMLLAVKSELIEVGKAVAADAALERFIAISEQLDRRSHGADIRSFLNTWARGAD